MRTTTGNKRLDEAIRKELKVNRGGQIWLDCFMGRTSHIEIAPTITTLRDNNNFIMERNMNEDKTTKVTMTLDGTYEQSNRVYDVNALAPTMQTCGGGQREPKIQEPINAMPDGTATTLTTAHHYSGNIVNPKRGQTEMGMREKFRIRKLTPRECFRLMDVDDKDIDTIQAAGISDSQQYKLAGNSIVVNVLTEIFRKLLVDTQNDDRQLRMF